MTRRILSLLALISLMLFSMVICHAQTASSATIGGTVYDPKGAVVPDASVAARNVETGSERTTKTSSVGSYRFDTLAPGTYDVRVEGQGFAVAEAKAVKLQVGEQRDVNFNLVISGATGSVTITSELPLVEASKTDVSRVVSDKEVATMPTTTSFNGIGGVANDYAALATTAPGVRYDTSGVSSDLLAPGAVNDRGIQYNIDGGNIADQVVSARTQLGASVEEVKEFQVLTNNYNAEYGQSGGLILNVVTKSGTNGFHGDGHYYTRGRNLTANTFFFNQNPTNQGHRPPFHKYEGGGTFGGPIIKNRTFFFTSYEQVREGVPLTLTPGGRSITLTQPTKELLVSGKIDHQFTKSNQFTARYNVQRDLQDNLLVQIAPIATQDSLVSSVVHDVGLNLADTWTISPTTINEARFFFHRFLSQTPVKSELPGQQGPGFYHGAAFCCPQGALDKRYEVIDNLTMTRGTHTFKVGTSISHAPYFSLFTQFNKGLYTYQKPETGPGSAPFASPGNPANKLTIGIGPAQVNARDNIYGFYGQDSWKFRPNVTLNLGLRYDVEVGAFVGGTIKQGNGCLQANGIIPACSSDHNNFQPRVGLAWSPRYSSGFLHRLFGDQDRTVIRLSFAEITMMAYGNVSLDSLNFDGVNLFTVTATPTSRDANGNLIGPAILAFAPNRPPDSLLTLLKPANFFGRLRPIASDLKNPETRNVHASFNRQFGKDYVVELGFTGVYGFGLFGERDTNFPIVAPDPAHPGFFYLKDGGLPSHRPDGRFNAIRTNENTRTSSYNGGYISATKRLSNHFQFNGSYTLSKLLTSTEDFFGLSEPGDPRNIRAERGPAFNDIRHLVNFGTVYDTEKLTERRFIKNIVNNWTIGAVGSLQSGRPYPVSTGSGPDAFSFFPGAGNETQQRPNILPDGTLVSTNIASADGTNLLIGPTGAPMCPGCPQTTFLAPADASPLGPIDSFSGDLVDFQFLNGSLTRDAGRSRPYYRFDMSFIKAFPIRERMRLELKVDIFNIFNHTNFLLNNGNDTLNSLPISADPNCRSCLNAHTGRYIGSDGRVLNIRDLQSGRVSQDLQNPIFNLLGDPSSTDIARTIQVSVRFKF
jgi:Carboxypeptidase regulatory-like domain/TonB dependent receptor-like, beta-barrel